MKNSKIPFIIIVMLMCVGCNNTIKEKKATEKTEVVIQEFCFLNEYRFPDSTENIDILKLDIQIKGDSVIGNYNWLPALKDQRNGRLIGTIQDKKIRATYTYTQEGIQENTVITIILEEDKAIVTGDSPDSGLDTEVAKVPCNSK